MARVVESVSDSRVRLWGEGEDGLPREQQRWRTVLVQCGAAAAATRQSVGQSVEAALGAKMKTDNNYNNDHDTTQDRNKTRAASARRSQVRSGRRRHVRAMRALGAGRGPCSSLSHLPTLLNSPGRNERLV
jgi:hypothetical protein